MSYDDLVAARAKRVEKEAARERKVRCSRRKREHDVLDTNALD